ncbi:MAG: response regulator, partial [bacterium]
ILGNAQLAQFELSDANPARENLADIEKAATRAADLCRQLLAYSGKGRFVIKPVNLNEVITEMVHLLKTSISKRITLEYHLQDDLPAIEADAAQMHQVIMNLIINASESIKEENGIVMLSTGVMECDRECLEQMLLQDNLAEGWYVFAEVADTGCGMDQETQKKIFDPFFTTKFTGRGLGMAAVLGIVRSHNGAIKIDSAPGEGTVVKVIFPASEQKANVAQNSVETTQKFQGAGTILVVDDEETVRKMTRRILELVGFTVLTANDGLEGIEIFHQYTDEIILVLLDLTMPRLNGEETLRELYKIREDVPVILLSGYSEQEALKRTHFLRSSGFIQKPFHVDSLAAKVDEVLKR